jgi:hypothetical protein
MALIDVNWKPAHRQLKQFAGIFLVFFLGLAAYLHFRHDAALWVSAAVGGAAVLVGGAGLLAPPLIRPVYVAMMAVALPIGMVVSTVLLAVIYYLILTPIGIVLQLFGKDTMGKRFDKEARSYWVRRTPTEDVRRYFRQY